MTVQYFFLIYLYLMLALALGLAIYQVWKNANNSIQPTEKKLWQCPECHMAFITSGTRNTARCPRCNHLCRAPGKINKHFLHRE